MAIFHDFRKSPISAILVEIGDFSEIGAKMADFEIAGSIGADFFAGLNHFHQGFGRVVVAVFVYCLAFCLCGEACA